MIVRAERHERDFTILDNDVLRDRSLSLRARGLLGMLLTFKPGEKVSVDRLGEMCDEGRDALRNAMNELIEAGYAERRKWQDQRGQWVTETFVYERPTYGNPVLGVTSENDAKPLVEPTTGKGGVGSPGVDLRTEDLRTEGLSLRATPASPTAQPLVGHYVDECRKRGVDPPKTVRARIGREVRTLLAEGFSDEWLRAALRVMARDALSPAALPLVLMEYQAHLNGSAR